MRDRIIEIILILLIVSIISVMIFSGNIIDKYKKMSIDLDYKIINERKLIEEKEKILQDLKQNNELKKKNVKNMDEYIDTLKQKVKEYEK